MPAHLCALKMTLQLNTIDVIFKMPCTLAYFLHDFHSLTTFVSSVPDVKSTLANINTFAAPVTFLRSLHVVKVKYDWTLWWASGAWLKSFTYLVGPSWHFLMPINGESTDTPRRWALLYHCSLFIASQIVNSTYLIHKQEPCKLPCTRLMISPLLWNVGRKKDLKTSSLW